MIKQLLLAAILIFFGLNAKSQCNPAVPSNAVVVNSSQTINGGFDPIWVCSNAMLVSDGGFHNIFLEPGAVMTTGGGIDTIYVMSGASFFMNGGIHVIYYENLSDIQVAGGIPTQIFCPSLAFNYTNAPTNGCDLALSVSFQTSDSLICDGGCISFTDLSTNATSWQWSFPGATPSSSTDENPQDICYYSSGSFDVTLIVSDGNNSDTLTINNFINVISGLADPTLTLSSDTIISSQGYGTYQWYFNSILIPGATDYFYVAAQSGLYSVVVTGDQGCGEASATISYIATGMESASFNSQLVIFPNPASRLVTLQFNTSSFHPFKISIVDFLGRAVFNQTLTLQQELNELKFDFSAQPAGVYFINYSSSENRFSRKLVVVHN